MQPKRKAIAAVGVDWTLESLTLPPELDGIPLPPVEPSLAPTVHASVSSQRFYKGVSGQPTRGPQSTCR